MSDSSLIMPVIVQHHFSNYTEMLNVKILRQIPWLGSIFRGPWKTVGHSDNDLCVFHTAGGLQQPQQTMPQQSYPAAYPGLYQAKYSSVDNSNYTHT